MSVIEPRGAGAVVKRVGLAARRILVVEDDADGLEALSMLLEAHGYEVSVSCTGNGVLPLAAIVRPDVVVMDLGLPDTDGIDLIRRFRAAEPATTIVAFSGSSENERAARAAGADWFVLKPDSDTLEHVLACLREQRSEAPSAPPGRELTVAQR